MVIVSTSVITEESSTDELPPEIQERIESGEGVVVITAESSDRRGFGGTPGMRPSAGGLNFQAIQEAMESNPEIQELLQKAQSGNMSLIQEDQARLQELMQEALADAGIEAKPRRRTGQRLRHAPDPRHHLAAAISGSTITIDHNDDSGLSTDVEITDNTNISVISQQVTPADLTEGTNVAGTVQRGEGGHIFIVNLAVVPEQPSTAQGFGRGFLAPRGLLGLNNDTAATNLSNIEGTITEIDGQQISVETAFSLRPEPLRMTTNDDSRIISTNPGTIADITEGMAAIAFDGSPPNNLVIGPEFILQ